MLSHFIRFVRTPKGGVAILCGLLLLALIGAQMFSRETLYSTDQGQSKASLAETPKGGKAGLKNFVVHAAPQQLPPMALLAADGSGVGLEAFAGDWLVVNFWATWCAPCRKEMPQLDALAARYEGRGVKVLALSVDRGGADKPNAFLDSLQVRHLERLFDPSYKAARSARLIGLPTTLIVSPEGKEVGRLAGEADWDSPAVHRLLDGYLELNDQ